LISLNASCIDVSTPAEKAGTEKAQTAAARKKVPAIAEAEKCFSGMQDHQLLQDAIR
jgi:hypothetical protein